jgi:hypothetical protein
MTGSDSDSDSDIGSSERCEGVKVEPTGKSETTEEAGEASVCAVHEHPAPPPYLGQRQQRAGRAVQLQVGDQHQRVGEVPRELQLTHTSG